MDKQLDRLHPTHSLSQDRYLLVATESIITGRSIDSLLSDFKFGDKGTQASEFNDEDTAFFNVDEFIPDEAALLAFPEKLARYYGVLPLDFDSQNGHLRMATSHPLGILDRDKIERELGSEIQVSYVLADATEILQAIDKSYGVTHSLNSCIEELVKSVGKTTAETAIAQAPIARLVDALLQDAVSRRASDIHLSPETRFVRMQYRVDGVLHDACCLHILYWSAMLVRIKVLAGMDISETRLSQDGHVSQMVSGRRIDFRVASFPLITGENLVLRVLDRRRGFRSLTELVSVEDALVPVVEMLRRPSGLILVCGPTGAGKTTTLYAMIESLDATALNIMTLEDPVEYPLANIRQTTIQPGISFDFASGVRGVLRQDPDVLLVGEIRDQASCTMTCRAAMTGHLVLSSLHAGDCISAIVRLLELGAERSGLASSLSGIVTQRLVRKVCSSCQGSNRHCYACHGCGYSGRIALMECLLVSDEFKSKLQNAATEAELRKQAIVDGMVSIRENAITAIKQGHTTSQEVTRVLGSPETGIECATKQSQKSLS